MRTLLLCLIACLGSAAEAPALSAIITYTQRVETPDGMTRTTVFKERLLRAPGQVWQERILPDRPKPSSEAPEHLHPRDLGVAARHLTRNGSGALALEFVHPDGIRIHAEARDFPEVGFDGSWAAAFHILDPARLASLKPLPQVTTQPAPEGAQWLGTEDGGQYLRVLWSTRWELPLRIEAGSKDGRRVNLTEVQPGPLPASLPWDRLKGLPEKEYTDLLD